MSHKAPESAKPPAPGDRLLHYEIVGEIGRGGMGRILMANDTRLDRRVAIKVLPPEFVSDPERLARFQREAKALAALNHPNIVTIFGVEHAAGQHFLIMELVEGQTLKKLIPSSGCNIKEFFEIATALAEALNAANERGITHRDVKPENVIVTTSGRVKMLDFGLAKPSGDNTLASTMKDSDHDEITRDGAILGTVPYMSPEQVRGEVADHRSDIFSLGIIFYEMLTGRRPFQGESPAQLISAILRDTPSSVTQLRTGVPRHLGRIVRQCLEKDPRKRFQTAQDVQNQLRDLQKELELQKVLDSAHPIQAPTPSRTTISTPSSRSPIGSLVRSRPGLLGLLALVFAFNYGETTIEEFVKNTTGVGVETGRTLAAAMHWLEGSYRFQNHDVSSWLLVYGYSTAYFFVFPALSLAVAIALARRSYLAPFRVLSLAVTVVYAISLPFFLLFPVIERWAYPESGAILLSDLWSSKLIESFRPISGLDNCFPSFHVSLTMVIILVCFQFRLRLRIAVAALGTSIIVSTWVLGIHWLADIIAGAATAVIAVAVATRLDRHIEHTSQRHDPEFRSFSAPTARL